MDHSMIEYSFVGVWEKALTSIPVLNQRFCMDLFGDPYSTQHGLAPEGYVVFQGGGAGSVATKLTLNPTRIQVTGRDAKVMAKATLDTISYLENEIELAPMFSAVGLNSQQEWSHTDRRIGDWLGNRLLRPGLAGLSSHQKVRALTLTFIVELDGPDHSLHVRLEPRGTDPHGLYANLNDHQAGQQGLPEDLEKSLRDAAKSSRVLLEGWLEGESE